MGLYCLVPEIGKSEQPKTDFFLTEKRTNFISNSPPKNYSIFKKIIYIDYK